MKSIEPENFLLDDTLPIKGHFFEYSDKAKPLKPGVNNLKALLHVDTGEGSNLERGARIRRLETGVLYLIKEVFVSGIGVVELDLERTKPGNGSLAMGKF